MNEPDKAAQFFELSEKDDCVYFTGDKCECFIPQRYEDKGMLHLTSKVQTLAIFTMVINDTITCGLQLPAVIEIDPVETYTTTIDGEQFVVCVLHKGNKILTTLDLLKNNKLQYFIWTEFLSLGHFPSYMNYDVATTLFDDLNEVSGQSIGTDHALIELVMAHLFRDPDNKTIFYRHTAMTKKPAIISLRDIGYGASTTHSRIIGSYPETGLNSALLNPSKENNELEDMFRL